MFLLGSSLLTLSSPAWAQADDSVDGASDAAPADAAFADAGDIVVTAQKRSERLIDVPVSVAVVSGDNLKNLNFSQATDLQFLAPGLGLGDSNTPRGAGFRIRGLGTQIFAEGVEQSVGTVVDGVPLARAGQSLSDLVDIERVEVLRGPQGMLFGRNASAGVINIVTKKPRLDVFSLDAQASYGSDNDVQLGASASAPLAIDKAALRLTGFFNSRDGFVTNLRTGEDLNARRSYGLRGALLLKPVDDLEIIIRGDWSKQNNRANIWTIRRLNPASPLAPYVDFGLAADQGKVSTSAGPDNRVVNLSGPIFNRVSGWGASGEINYYMGDYTITSLTSYREWKQFDNNDADQTPLNILDRNDGGNDLDHFSQEIRISSPQNQFLTFVAGLFYYQSHNDSFNTRAGRATATFAAAAQFGVPIRYSALGITVPGDPVAIAPGDLAGSGYTSNIRIKDMAAFGQAEAHLSDQFKIIFGGRLTRTKVSADYDRFLTPGTSPVFNGVLAAAGQAAFVPLTYDLSTKDTNFSWRIGAQYQPSRDFNAFATVSRGYKGPGFSNLIDFTIPSGQTAMQAALIRPEIPTNYEAGIKGYVLDRAVSFGLTFFLTDIKDFQAQVYSVPIGQPGSFRVTNAGALRTKGFEAEVNLRPARGFDLGIGLAYADTKYRDFVGASCPRVTRTITAPNDGTNCGRISATANAPSFDASGRPAANAPKLTLSLNGRYEQELGGGMGGFIQGNALMRSDTSYATLPEGVANPYVQDGYVIVNGSVGVSAGDGAYTLSLFVKNLFDKNYVTQISDLPLGELGDYSQFVTRDAARTVGVQARINF
jgi:iron complex outermembrane receptor protein